MTVISELKVKMTKHTIKIKLINESWVKFVTKYEAVIIISIFNMGHGDS